MKIDDPNPFFRKAIVPWFDSDAACVMVILSMIPVFFFGCLGISVAFEDEAHRGYWWVPALLTSLVLMVIASTSFRLINRNLATKKKK